MLKKYSKLFVLLLAISDVVIIGSSFLLAYYLRFYSNIFVVTTVHPFDFYLYFFILAIALWLILFTALDLYKPRRTNSVFADAKPLFLGNALGILVICSFSFFYREHSYSRLTFILFGGINFVLLQGSRFVIRGFLKWLRKKGYNKRRALIVGAGKLGLRVAKAFQQPTSYGYEVIGFLDDVYTNGKYKKQGLEILGRTSCIKKILNSRNVDRVIIALPIKDYKKIYHIVTICEAEGVETDIVPDLFQIVQPITKVINFNGLPMVSVRRTPVNTWTYRVLKRIFDIIFSLLILIVTLPITILIAVGIKLTSPGPIFFKQERIGKKRKPFLMYKFRTMRVCSKKVSDTIWTLESDKRRTKFGVFLRKTSLDELPQFINVLKGDMSVVGPRPERPYFAKRFKGRIPKYMVRYQVRTGITGLAQVNGWRGDTSIKKRLEHDLFYLENWSLWLDLKIILKTIINGLINKNAY
ncbi:MAG: undecaprenyl-phosphate glucose phosphotransferase [bacterium]